MQTSYNQDYVNGQAGQIADTSNRVIGSFAAEGEIAFGIAVERGTNREKQVVPYMGGEPLGISVFEHNENGLYNDGDSVSVATSGRFYVMIDALVVAGDMAFATPGTGDVTNVPLGMPIGKFLTSGTGIVVLELKLFY